GGEDLGERGLKGLVPTSGDLFGGESLLAQDPVDGPRRLVVLSTLGHSLQLLIAADLQVLERVREPGQLGRGVRLGLEEGTPVERSETHAGVLQEGRRAADRLQPASDALLVTVRLL